MCMLISMSSGRYHEKIRMEMFHPTISSTFLTLELKLENGFQLNFILFRDVADVLIHPKIPFNWAKKKIAQVSYRCLHHFLLMN